MMNTVNSIIEEKTEKLNSETLAAINDVDNNKNMSEAFEDIDELMKDLNA